MWLDAEGVEPGWGADRDVSRQRSWHRGLRSVIAERVKVRSWSCPWRFWSTGTSTSPSRSYDQQPRLETITEMLCYNFSVLQCKRMCIFFTFSRQASIAVNIEWRSSRVGERRDLETRLASIEEGELKLSGVKQTKNGENLIQPSFSRYPTCPRSFERRFMIQLKI